MFLLFCIFILVNLGEGLFLLRLSRHMKYGLWSENCFISIPDDAFNAVLFSLQKTKLSISVPLVFEILVGCVMEG